MRFCNVRIIERKGKSTATKEAKPRLHQGAKRSTRPLRGMENRCSVVACGERRLEPIMLRASSLITNRTRIEMSRVYL